MVSITSRRVYSANLFPRFDDNVATIVEGHIQVWLDDMKIDKDEDLEGADDEEELPDDSPQLYPGSAFPMKVTEMIGNDELVMMFKRYRNAFQLEEMRGKEWRLMHDRQHALKSCSK